MLCYKTENNKLKLYKDNYELGFLEYQIPADEAQIIHIEIDEKYRRQGYGKKLLKAFIDKTIGGNSNCRLSYIILEVRRSNNAAINLYKKAGFKQIDLRKGYYNDPKEDGVIMKLTLEPAHE